MSEVIPNHIGALRHTKVIPSGTYLVGDEMRSRILQAISNSENPEHLAARLVHGSLDSVRGTSKGIKTSFESIFNSTLKSLEVIRTLLQKQPELTLNSIDTSISAILEDEGVGKDGILDIHSHIVEVRPENFIETLEGIQKRLGDVGIIYFLEGCIHEGKVYGEIEKYTSQQKEKHSSEKQSIAYWNFSNILNLLDFKKRLTTLPSKKGNSLSISGGAGNMFSVLGSLETHLLKGQEISSITGSSMGSAIAIIGSIVQHDRVKLSQIMKDIRDGFEYNGISYKNDGLIVGKNIPRLKEFIVKLFEKYGITESTRFNDLPIPVIINASRIYKGGEQEIYLSGENKVLESVFASMNIPKGNTGLLGNTEVDGIPLFDHSTNIKGNPLHILRSVGIEDKSIIAFDGGYSSERLNTILSIIFRKTYPKALQWDFLSKLNLSRGGGKIIDLKSPGIRSFFGYRLSPKLTEAAYSEGRNTYTETISQSSQ